MAWEQVKRGNSFASYHGQDWQEKPCVSIGKTHMSFNRVFLEVFGFSQGETICVCVDSKGRRLGFRRPNSDADAVCSFRLTKHGPASKSSSSASISCRWVNRKFPELIGRDLVARLVATEALIVADFSSISTPPPQS